MLPGAAPTLVLPSTRRNCYDLGSLLASNSVLCTSLGRSQMTRCFRFMPLAVLAVFAFAFAGCKPAVAPANKPAADHDHDHEHEAVHDTSKTYAEAVAKLETLRNTVRDSLAKKETDPADDAVHNIGRLLERLPGLAKQENFAADDQAAIEKATKDMFDQFDKLDIKLHDGQKDVKFDAYEQPVGEALDVLKSKLKKEG